MSDFDKHFGEKLNEEGSFPNREKNWKSLSRRLDAFDTGVQYGNPAGLRYWKIAAAVSLLVSAWAFWEVYDIRHKNAELRRQITVLQENPKPERLPVAPEKEMPYVQDAFQGNDDRPESLVETPHTPDVTTAARTPELPPQYIVVGGQRYTRESTSKPAPQMEQIPAGDESRGQALPEKAPGNIAEIRSEDVKKILPFSELPVADPAPLTVKQPQPDIAALFPQPPLPDSAASRTAAAFIKPVSEPSRFRAGMQAMVGFALPAEKGVSTITGTGITAGYHLRGGLQLTASADWVRFDVSTQKYLKRFHPHPHDPPSPPPPPPGGFPPKKLVHVESTQRQQHFALGLQYQMPLRSRLRPAIRIAHTWVRVSPELVTFKFAGPPHSGQQGFPEYKVQKSEAKHLGNIWRAGIGVEYETPQWVFGLWADYAKNFGAADPDFDILMLKAGVQYRFN